MVSVRMVQECLGPEDVLPGHEPGVVRGVHTPVEEADATLFHLVRPVVSSEPVHLVVLGDLLKADVRHAFVPEQPPGLLEDRTVPLPEAHRTDHAAFLHGRVDPLRQGHVHRLGFLAEELDALFGRRDFHVGAGEGRHDGPQGVGFFGLEHLVGVRVGSRNPELRGRFAQRVFIDVAQRDDLDAIDPAQVGQVGGPGEPAGPVDGDSN